MAKDKITTRERILDEAARIIQTRGFRGMSISELLEAADISKGSLYFHFRSKHELGLAVLERARQDFMDFLHKSLIGETPKDRLFNFFDRALTEHKKMRFVGGCLWGNTALEMGDCDTEYALYVADVFDKWAEMLEKVIADGQKAGQFRDDISADKLARTTLAVIEGGIMQARLRKDEITLKSCFDSLRTLLNLS